jgi:hypothetical protein
MIMTRADNRQRTRTASVGHAVSPDASARRPYQKKLSNGLWLQWQAPFAGGQQLARLLEHGLRSD